MDLITISNLILYTYQVVSLLTEQHLSLLFGNCHIIIGGHLLPRSSISHSIYMGYL